jgi:hypothetical protein
VSNQASTSHIACELMNALARRQRERPRDAHYLWTDAFAVCNYVSLSRALGDESWLGRAVDQVERVHATLGKHRDDDARTGWLDAPDHPTRRGLRIGKRLPERGEHERFDPRLEWDRDGQYFHYLTRWMHALDVVARARQDRRLSRLAYELAITAHDAFVRDGRMVWKMSIDLSRPLVASMGQHDPLDGLVTFAQLRETARALGGAREVAELGARIESFTRLLDARNLATDDPLGLGGLLVDACRIGQLAERHALDGAQTLESRVLRAAEEGLEAYRVGGELDRPAEERLAFRELGLAIGLTAFDGWKALRERIVSFWNAPENRRNATFLEHRDINEVMLATSLVPDGYLVLRALPIARRSVEARQ